MLFFPHAKYQSLSWNNSALASFHALGMPWLQLHSYFSFTLMLLLA